MVVRERERDGEAEASCADKGRKKERHAAPRQQRWRHPREPVARFFLPVKGDADPADELEVSTRERGAGAGGDPREPAG